MMTSGAELLSQAEAYLREFVAPQAAVLDQDPQVLRQALWALGDRALLALRIPEEWGGRGVDELTYRVFQEQIARYSGALAFLQTQHQSAANFLVHSPNQVLQTAYLPQLSRGEKLLGVGFSQLRRSGPPLVKALPVAGGYQIYGEVPWITGYGCFHEFIVGATLPDGRVLFGLMPLGNVEQEQGGSIHCSAPMTLAAMESTNTVKAQIMDWVIPEAYVVAIQPADWIQVRDRRNVLHHSFFALGCAQAGLDILRTAQRQTPAFVADTGVALNAELKTCREQIYQAHQADAAIDEKQSLRAWAIDLAVRCSHAAVAVSRGAANNSHHPAQRVYREALAFTVFGQTTAVMEATLARLVQPQRLKIEA